MHRYFAVLFALFAVLVLVPLPSSADEPWWHCTGHVHDCHSPDYPNAEGCADVMGVGPTEPQARSDAAYDCTLLLSRMHGGEWTCNDTSKLKCWQNTNGGGK